MDHQAKLVSLLFYSAEPIGIGQILKTFGISKNELEELKDSANKSLEAVGLMLISDSDTMQLTVQSGYSALIEEFYKTTPQELSQPALEVLSIIAYKQPIGKSDIDEIRGVSSEQSLRNLLNKSLIKKVTKATQIKFVTTAEFMKVVGISSINQLEDNNE
jgi:segregation and condensation protein B